MDIFPAEDCDALVGCHGSRMSDTWALALGIAASPFPIIPAILLVFTLLRQRADRKAEEVL